MNPMMAAGIGQAASAVGQGVAQGIANSTLPPSISSGSNAYGGTSGGTFDFSGWTVSTGGNQGTSNAVGAPHPVTTSAPLDMQTLALYALIAVVAIRVWGK